MARSCCFSGTNGLGAAAAKMLASRNPARIYITGRKEAAAQQTISDIKSGGSTAEVEWISCDHADLYSVREAADMILARQSRLDVLMANAGISKHTQDSVDCLRGHAMFPGGQTDAFINREGCSQL
jgi:NAD(P)-dependent dehydrogenase (short-subunit alcohol dehydrogenase family)